MMKSYCFPLPSVHITHFLQGCSTTKKLENYIDWKLLNMFKVYTSYLEIKEIILRGLDSNIHSNDTKTRY